MKEVEQLKFIIRLVVVMVGLWMLITPLYDYVKEVSHITPIISVMVGAVIVLMGLMEWDIKLW